MTKATAQRYSGVFKALTNPESLVVLDYLREKGGEITLNELAEAASTSESRTRVFLNELESVYLVNESTNSEGEVTYYYESTTVADRFKYILQRMQ